MVTRTFIFDLGIVSLCLLTFAEGGVGKTLPQPSDQKVEHAEQLAITCVACHGANGKSLNSVWPNLAGQKKDYLSKQLHDFKEARRENLIMQPMAQTLSNADIEILAKYFSEMNP